MKPTKTFYTVEGEYFTSTGCKKKSGTLYNVTKEEAKEKALADFKMWFPKSKAVTISIREESESAPTRIKLD